MVRKFLKISQNFSKFSFNDLTDFTTHDIDQSGSQQLFTIVLAVKYLFFPLLTLFILQKNIKKNITASYIYNTTNVILTKIYNATSMEPQNNNHQHVARKITNVFSC